MAEFTCGACFLADTNLMALPALFVNYDFRAEGLVGDIGGIGAMAAGAGVRLLLHLFRFVVANLAFDRGRLEVVGMRRIQFLRVYLMVTLATLDRAILHMHLVSKCHFPH